MALSTATVTFKAVVDSDTVHSTFSYTYTSTNSRCDLLTATVSTNSVTISPATTDDISGIVIIPNSSGVSFRISVANGNASSGILLRSDRPSFIPISSGTMTSAFVQAVTTESGEEFQLRMYLI